MPTDILLVFLGGLAIGLLVAGFGGWVWVHDLRGELDRAETTRDTYVNMCGDRSAAILKIWEIVKEEIN